MRAAVSLLVLAGCTFRPSDAATNAAVDAAHASDAAHARDDGSAMTSPDAPGSASAIEFRQVASHEDISQQSEVVTFGMPELAGDLNVVMVGWYKPGTITQVFDTANNSYAIAAGPTMTGSDDEYQTIYYACGVAAGADAVSVVFDSASQDPDVRIAEYSGLRATACFDTAVANTGGGTAVDSGPIAVGTGELLVGADKVYNLTATGDASFDTRTITGFGDIVEDVVTSAAGTYDATATENTTGVWVMQLAAFH
jgi:hypothetical protein